MGLVWCAASWGCRSGTGPALAGIVREVGLRADALRGKGCYDPMLVPALSRCCSFFPGALGKELLQDGDWVV
jgi:hypothetical protein